jgi:hypothetical protein
MLYDVKVLIPENLGTWTTDLVTGSKHRATERCKYLMGHVQVATVTNQYGDRVQLEGA